MPFFIGSEKLVGVTTAVSTAATDNAAISSLLDTALSSKHDNATIKAWRRIVSGNASLVASAGPALSGELKCFVGDIGQVTGLQYGSAVVCQKSDRVVNVKIGTNYVSNIKVSDFFFESFSLVREDFGPLVLLFRDLYIPSSFFVRACATSCSSSCERKILGKPHSESLGEV